MGASLTPPLWIRQWIRHKLLFSNYDDLIQVTWKLLMITTVLVLCETSGGSKRGAGDAHPPGSKFFQFHAVFGKFRQNHTLAPPGSWRPLLGEILDPPLETTQKITGAQKDGQKDITENYIIEFCSVANPGFPNGGGGSPQIRVGWRGPQCISIGGSKRVCPALSPISISCSFREKWPK